jgi:hypothetical protein
MQFCPATTLFGVATAVAVVAAPAMANLIVYEGFDYTSGNSSPDPDAGLNGGNGLPATNAGGNPTGTSTGLRGNWTASVTVTASSLAYADSQGNTLNTTGNALRPVVDTWTDAQNVYRNMTTDPYLALRESTNGSPLGEQGTTLYASFLWRTSNVAERNHLVWNSSTVDSGTGNASGSNVYLGNSSSGALGISRGAGGGANTTVLPENDTTYFVVLRVEYGADNLDTMSMWINPRLDQALGTADATLSGYNFNFQSVQARRSGGNTGAFEIDEFRIGTTYADVSPYAIPEPASLGMLGLAGLALRRRR